MFYISPHFISSLPVFDLIQENVPYVLFLIIYVVLLMLGAAIILGISKLVLFLHRRIVK
jgi:ABC-type dipeptide/oligopeptide/nickel transport system permease component